MKKHCQGANRKRAAPGDRLPPRRVLKVCLDLAPSALVHDSGMGLACVLSHTEQHPWLLLTGCQWHPLPNQDKQAHMQTVTHVPWRQHELDRRGAPIPASPDDGNYNSMERAWRSSSSERTCGLAKTDYKVNLVSF